MKTKKLLALILALAMALSVNVPAFAEPDTTDVNILPLANGTYSIADNGGYSTGMFAPDESDGASYVVVNNNDAWLVTQSYAPNKYDAVWKGKRTEAPSDPAAASVINGIFVEDENGAYKSGNHAYSGNVYKINGVSYKAVRFVIPLTTEELKSGLVYFVLRRAPWSSSNPGQWMGSDNHSFTFGTLTKTGDSVEVPKAPSTPLRPAEPAETFGFTLQVGQYQEGADFHTASFEGVTYSLKDENGTTHNPSNATSGTLTYSGLDSSMSYTFTASKDGWAVVTQGEWDTAAHAYTYNFTGADEISVTITSEDAGKNIIDAVKPGMIFRKKPRVENDVDRALALVPEDLSIFTDASVVPLNRAVEATDPETEDADTLASMAAAVISGIQGLVPKDGSYSAKVVVSDGSMFKILDVISLEVENGQMTLDCQNGSETFTYIYLGTIEEAIAANPDRKTGTFADAIAHGNEITASNNKSGFRWSIPVDKLEKEIMLAAFSSSSSKLEFNSTGNFTVKANSLKSAAAEGTTELAITNNTGMFKAVTASLVKTGTKTELVMALSGTGYKELFKGTYEEAIDNGDGREGKGGKAQWIHAKTNDDGKLEFRIPLNDGETYVPLVTISNSYLTKYDSGQNALERSFYPRQITVDYGAKTIVTDDYNTTLQATVTSNVNTFKVEGTTEMEVVGGPNSNNYKLAPVLVMKDKTYDQVTYPTVVDNAVSTATANIDTDTNSFTISMVNAPNLAAFTDKQPISMQFHVAGSDTSVERTLTIDIINKTITINGDELADYTELDAALAKIPEVLTVYTDASVANLNTAVNAVVRGLMAGSENQARVDAMTAAVKEAVAGLVKKSSGGGSGSGGTTVVTVPDESTALSIVNTTAMFKGDTASIDTISGKYYLTVTLTGNTYHYLYKGSYRQAVDNGDKRENWIEGYQNESGKWEFKIPIDKGDKTVHAVSISETYLATYEKGENAIERAFYPRTFDIDYTANELTVGDYHATVSVSVKSGISSIKTASSGSVDILGGPYSNTYSVTPTITMLDDAYDQITYKTLDSKNNVVEETADLTSGKTFTFNVGKAVLWNKRGSDSPTALTYDGSEPIEIGFRNKETQEIETYPVTIDLLKNTITIGTVSSSSGSSGTDTAAAEAAATLPSEKSVEVNPQAAAVNGEAAVKASEKSVSEAVSKAAKDDEVKNIEIKPEIKGSADKVSVELSKNSLKEIADSGLGLVVTTEQGSVKLANGELNALTNWGDLSLETAYDSEKLSVSVDLVVGGRKTEAGMSVKLPKEKLLEEGESETGKVLCLVDADGNETVIKKSVIVGDVAAALVKGSCTLKLKDNGKEFSDAASHWASSAIDFVSSHELFGGTGEGVFEPNTTMSRAMLATVLYRLEDAVNEGEASAFDDVEEGKWYSDAVAWAASSSIVNGTGEGFEPNGEITRQQLATMLYRYAEYIGLDTDTAGDSASFSDSEEISSWAGDALSWAVGSGLIGGRDGNVLAPKDSATRAETATIFGRMVKLIVK